ncbi:hypothetical protein ACFYNY_14765 [Streptomyces sp. NPDC006530]|uniref:hypothetical protein n=1 Tax=Streptomyces sp. NPDC006530 TaxID=3364750 RepID=UPI0036B0D1F3
MDTRHPGLPVNVVAPVAAGWRLLFVPNRARELAFAFGASIMLPSFVAAPFLLTSLVIAAIWGSSFLWGWFWVLLTLTVVAAILLAAAMVYVTVATGVRWVELRPLETPAQVVVARFLRSSTMAMTELRQVVVIEHLSLGRRKSLKVVLHIRGETVECEPATSAPFSRVDAQELAGWLTDQLAPFQVPVERRTEVKRDFVRPDEWWTPSHTAELWQVPVDEVDRIAAQRGVETYGYTPRAHAMYNPGASAIVYDPARAYEVAEELRAERAAGRPAARSALRSSDGPAAPGPAQNDSTDPH